MKPQIRINDPAVLDHVYIEKELREGRHVIVQFSEASYHDKKLSELNDLCKKFDENFGVRFYGHYSGSFDSKILLKIPDVKCLYVDCLLRANHVPAVAELNRLHKLCLGIFELKETEILKAENLKRLRELTITETKTKAFNLEYLKDYHNLKLLIIGGHTKNIEAVGEISRLEFLSLNSISKVPVPFINKLKLLKTLKFILGGRENIHEIEENQIENLEIICVRGFNDISNISKFKKLKSLLIEDQLKLSKIHFEKDLPELQDLRISNCKTLHSLTSLQHLHGLQKLNIYKTNVEFTSMVKQPLPQSLKIFSFHTTKKKSDAIIKASIEKLGYSGF